jgi:hypothetical protein
VKITKQKLKQIIKEVYSDMDDENDLMYDDDSYDDLIDDETRKELERDERGLELISQYDEQTIESIKKVVENFEQIKMIFDLLTDSLTDSSPTEAVRNINNAENALSGVLEAEENVFGSPAFKIFTKYINDKEGLEDLLELLGRGLIQKKAYKDIEDEMRAEEPDWMD